MKIKRLLAGLTAACMITAITPVFAKNDLTLYDGQVSVEAATKNGLLAFPGAEGGGNTQPVLEESKTLKFTMSPT